MQQPKPEKQELRSYRIPPSTYLPLDWTRPSIFIPLLKIYIDSTYSYGKLSIIIVKNSEEKEMNSHVFRKMVEAWRVIE
ncbi:hypothetical protein PUR_43490 [Paenibacillus sp. URB8-2]|nr:hypothetical protein PUR_43490 [Paenibacillus sp. URB8-2]